MSSRERSHDRYMPQLNALRAFAVLAVIVQHYWPRSATPGPLRAVEWGGYGVRLFFVLSGFLITGILLRYRDEIERGAATAGAQLRRFVIRRTLRIFPIYYLVVLAVCILGIGPARQVWPYLLTYTTNWHIAASGAWIGQLSHLWSLAAEEQFYLAWPLVALLAPRRWLLPTTLLVIAAAPAYRCVAALAGWPYSDLDLLPLIALEALGIGALLAQGWHARSAAGRWERALCRWVAPVALVAIVAMEAFHGSALTTIWLGFATALVSAALIHAAGRGIGGPVGALLLWPPLGYLGQISYGLYLYHHFVTTPIALVFRVARVPYPYGTIADFLICLAATVAAASVSWYLIESPINGWKDRLGGSPRSERGRLQVGEPQPVIDQVEPHPSR